MRPRRASVDEARPYFAHETQVKGCLITPENLPGEPFEYWVCDGVCGVFHPDHWPGVYMGHYGVMVDAWGHTVEPARDILAAFWAERKPDLIIGWTPESNRAALSFVKRIGFREIGKMTLPGGNVVMTEYR